MLTDAEWAEVARRVVAATGIAPEGDDKACRWIAVRHADDHIHIMATSVRADGRRPRTNRDGWRAQRECRKIEAEFGLRRLKSGDLTAPLTPTGAERAKAERQGRDETAREWLREQAYAVAAAVRSIDEYFTVLRSLGIQVRPRIGPETGEVTGYSLAAPSDTTQGEPVWYGGSRLAPDLSYNRLCERLPTQDLADRPEQAVDPAEPWHRAETAVRDAHTALDSGDDAMALGHLDAFGDTLHNLALATKRGHRAELQAAARAFNRARRSAIRADHQAATALREAAKELAYATHDPGGLAIALIFAALHVARAAAKWHEQRRHEQQAAAAEEAFRHLQAGYQQAAQPVLADLARQAPRATTVSRFEQDLRAVLPDHADRVLADPVWPLLVDEADTIFGPKASGDSEILRGLLNAGHQRNRPAWRISGPDHKPTPFPSQDAPSSGERGGRARGPQARRAATHGDPRPAPLLRLRPHRRRGEPQAGPAGPRPRVRGHHAADLRTPVAGRRRPHPDRHGRRARRPADRVRTGKPSDQGSRRSNGMIEDQAFLVSQKILSTWAM